MKVPVMGAQACGPSRMKGRTVLCVEQQVIKCAKGFPPGDRGGAPVAHHGTWASVLAGAFFSGVGVKVPCEGVQRLACCLAGACFLTAAHADVLYDTTDMQPQSITPATLQAIGE